MNLFYAFHNPSKVQHQNLTPEEFKKKLLEDTNLSNWLIWKPGMKEWLSATEIPEVKELLSQVQAPPPLPQPPPIPPEMKTSSPGKKEEEEDFFIVDYAEETKPVQLTPKQNAPKPAASKTASSSKPPASEKEKVRNDRQHPRIKGRLRTIITNRERAFITYTRDISLGGVFLEHAIPDDLLKGSVDIFITAPTGKDSIVFRCQPIQNQSGQYRFSFVGIEAQNQEKLTQWLDHLSITK